MRNFDQEIEDLIKLIPTDFPCEPGCSDCCTKHIWSWNEWRRVPSDKQFNAYDMEAKCPFASDQGCFVYEFRPVICRLYGNAGDIGRFGPFERVTLKCPRGIEPKTKLSPPEARRIFRAIMDIRNQEVKYRLRAGAMPVFAGPYGRHMVMAGR